MNQDTDNLSVSSINFKPSEVLNAITLLRQVAVAYHTALGNDAEETKSLVLDVRSIIALLIDFNDLQSPHFDLREVLLSKFDQEIAAVSEQQELEPPQD